MEEIKKVLIGCLRVEKLKDDSDIIDDTNISVCPDCGSLIVVDSEDIALPEGASEDAEVTYLCTLCALSKYPNTKVEAPEGMAEIVAEKRGCSLEEAQAFIDMVCSLDAGQLKQLLEDNGMQ